MKMLISMIQIILILQERGAGMQSMAVLYQNYEMEVKRLICQEE
jgi:hypothetical protein